MTSAVRSLSSNKREKALKRKKSLKRSRSGSSGDVQHLLGRHRAVMTAIAAAGDQDPNKFSRVEQNHESDEVEVLPPTEMVEDDTPLPRPAVSPSSSATGEGLVTKKPISQMSVFEVGELIEELTKDADVGHRFREEEIDGAALLLLPESTIDLLVTKIGHRIRLKRLLGLIGPVEHAAPSPRAALFGMSDRTPARAIPLQEIIISQAEKRQRQLESLVASGKVDGDGGAGAKQKPQRFDFDESKIRVRARGGSQCVTIHDRASNSWIPLSKCNRASDRAAFKAIVDKLNAGLLHADGGAGEEDGDVDAVGNNNANDVDKEEGSGDNYKL